MHRLLHGTLLQLAQPMRPRVKHCLVRRLLRGTLLQLARLTRSWIKFCLVQRSLWGTLLQSTQPHRRLRVASLAGLPLRVLPRMQCRQGRASLQHTLRPRQQRQQPLQARYRPIHPHCLHHRKCC